nr:unnamed protein product [Callosobruchus chinensis]
MTINLLKDLLLIFKNCETWKLCSRLRQYKKCSKITSFPFYLISNAKYVKLKANNVKRLEDLHLSCTCACLLSILHFEELATR